MTKRDFCAKLLVAAIWVVAAGEAEALDREPVAPVSDRIGWMIRARLGTTGAADGMFCRGEPVCTLEKLRSFYESRLFSPVWSNDDGMLPFGEDLIRELQNARQEGLRAEDYHLYLLQSLREELRTEQSGDEPPSIEKLVDLDLLLTDAFFMYASHLVNGKVNPWSLQTGWYVTGRKADPASLLEQALHANRIPEMLRGLHPGYPGYARLRKALAYYRRVAEIGGWGSVPPGGRLRQGDSGPRVAALRERLAVSDGPDRDPEAQCEVFDGALEEAVKRYQVRHGLTSDGIVGPLTLKALNVPAWQRVAQIRWNMERWRWLPETLGSRYLLVNIADFHLEVREDERVVLRMRAIVGTPYQKTQIFSAKMTYLVLNPHWNVPAKIVKEEMLGEIQKDPDYLFRNKIKILSDRNGKRIEVDPSTIDWSSLNANGLPFLFRQDAGPGNALGRVKFMLPNEFEIYLHDTPHRELFKRTARQFSHGCIRIEKPLELAEYLLQGDPGWTAESLTEALESQVDKTVRLPEPMDVHILYWTAWADEDGTVQFREDIYDQDAPLAQALERRPPRP